MRWIVIILFLSLAACSQKVSNGKTEQKFGPCKQTTEDGHVEQRCKVIGGQDVEY